MYVRITESLHAGEMLDTLASPGAHHWFVDPKIMAVTVDQHDRFAECNRFLLQQFQPLIESEPDLVGGGEIKMRIRLDDQHHTAIVLLFRKGKRFLQPRSEERRVGK